MEIRINRTVTNSIYTEGEILVNNQQKANTVEHTPTMLPAGNYLIRLRKHKSMRRIVRISKTDWSIGIGRSWKTSQKKQVIAIGQQLIPGIVYKATSTYGRLFERIEKCQIRKEPVNLVIDENQCINNQPIKHWTKA